MPVVESIPTAAKAIPYNPLTEYAAKIPTQIKITGTAVDCIPTANPLIMAVPGPVSAWSAIFFTKL